MKTCLLVTYKIGGSFSLDPRLHAVSDKRSAPALVPTQYFTPSLSFVLRDIFLNHVPIKILNIFLEPAKYTLFVRHISDFMASVWIFTYMRSDNDWQALTCSFGRPCIYNSVFTTVYKHSPTFPHQNCHTGQPIKLHFRRWTLNKLSWSKHIVRSGRWVVFTKVWFAHSVNVWGERSTV